jgi:hypothetical protein
MIPLIILIFTSLKTIFVLVAKTVPVEKQICVRQGSVSCRKITGFKSARGLLRETPGKQKLILAESSQQLK